MLIGSVHIWLYLLSQLLLKLKMFHFEIVLGIYIFIHSIILSIYCMLCTILGAWNISMNKTNKTHCLGRTYI